MRAIHPYGPSAFLVAAESTDEVFALAALRVPGVIQVVPGARTLLVECAEDAVAAAANTYAIGDVSEGFSHSNITKTEIAVRYDGEDLADVARATGLSVDEVIALHSGGEYRVALCGFVPGFAYVDGLPPQLHLPRRASPRERVPAGTLAIAGRWTGVYPRATPGGWHLLGTTTARMWDVTREPASLLRPGDRVTFRPV